MKTKEEIEKTAAQWCRDHNSGSFLTKKAFTDACNWMQQSQWKPISEIPTGEKIHRMVFVRRQSDEILLGRYTNQGWAVYFNDMRGFQTPEDEMSLELKRDPVVDWQDLPLTPQQIELLTQDK